MNTAAETLPGIQQDESGYYYFFENGAKVVLYLSEELFPDDNSIEKLRYLCNTFPVDEKIIGLPDLHFKIKNFVPSGMTIPLQGQFSPKLLGPNNDGMGALSFSTSQPLAPEDITRVFQELKRRIVMFRRSDAVVNENELEDLLLNGITNVIEEWGFKKSELNVFEDKGCSKRFDDLKTVEQVFPDKRSPLLPEFVPGHDPLERGSRCLGVLDGTSHFIELFRHAESFDPAMESALNVHPQTYFMLVHAGSGDVGLISHRAYLDQHDNLYNPNSEIGAMAFDSFMVAGNYGFANRLFIYREIKAALEEMLPELEEVTLLSDCPHDYLSVDNGRFIHRKGSVKLEAAHSYSENHVWEKTGTPYLFPSAVGGDAYIVSNPEGNPQSLFTASHGAGRLIKKDQAIQQYGTESIESALQNEIMLFRYGVDTIEGQNPKAFKNVDEILQLFQRFHLATPISRLVPLASLKA
ncbi:MAG: RtcB family protein [Rhodothermaceae bacterium]|nr:RtcB family protein [Rhodothermaceae bacterium]